MKKLNKKITGYIALMMAVALCIGILPAQNANASEGPSAQDTEIFADVEAELTLDKEEVVLGDEDIIEDEWVYEEYYRLYAENVYITLTVQGKVESIYSNAYVRFDYQTVYMFDYDLFLGNEPSSQFRPYAFMMNYYESIDEFVKQYKRKAVKAGGNRPKEIIVEDDTSYIKVIVKY